jgi:hypothetical protein
LSRLRFDQLLLGLRGVNRCSQYWSSKPFAWLSRAAEASAVEEGQVQLVEALGIGDRVDLDDLAVPDLEVQYHKEPSTRGHDDTHGAVHERRTRGPGTSYERPPGHGRCTVDLPRYARRQGGAVGSEHDVRVEHRDKRVEVSIARGGEEGVDDLSLAGVIRLVRSICSPHASARAARELPRRVR